MSRFEPAFIVKICGITTAEDVSVAIDAGANAIGFNFYPKGPRYIHPEVAAAIQTPGGCLRVGVFVNSNASELIELGRIARLDVLQLHGENAEIPNGFRVWQSIPAGFEGPRQDRRIEAYLMDTPSAGYGGSGQTFDWNLAKDFPFRMIVAGGLTPDNVADAIARLKPWGVDACSRLESAPGKKDPALVRSFVRAALAAMDETAVGATL